MGIQLFGSYLVAFFTIIYALMAETDIDISKNRDISTGINIAAKAAATKWDKEATAEAGMIILDEDQAASTAVDFFSFNTGGSVDWAELYIEIVNNAPTTRFIDGNEYSFVANGVILKYKNFIEIVEADDRSLEQILEENKEDEDDME